MRKCLLQLRALMTAVLIVLILGFFVMPVNAVEPAAQPTGLTIDQIIPNSMRVNWDALPGDTDGVLVVVSAGPFNTNDFPQDGTVYTANASLGDGDRIISWKRQYAVYDGSGTSVTVTNLQAPYTYHVCLFAYQGSGAGIDYVNDTSATATATTPDPPILSHNELVFPLTYQDNDTCTSNCHGSHHTTDLLPRGLAQYNKCFACHFSGGPVGASPNIGLHLSDGSVDCGTCHSLHSFRLAELYSDATAHTGGPGYNQKFIRSNMSKYLNVDDFTPPVGPPKDALDNTVFQNPPGDFAFADGATPYNGVCQTCHTQTKFHNQTEPTDNDHQVGNNCSSCHPHSSTDEYNAFQPAGGHLDTDFGWNEAVDNCDDCHSATPGAPTEAVVSSIHANNCDLCHVGGIYDKTSNGVGPAAGANGIDGDAYMAEYAADNAPPFDPTKYYCVTCHNPAAVSPAPELTPTLVDAATYGGIHHDNKNNSPESTANCAVRCHTATDHSTSINDSANQCNSCHTLTQGTATGAPVAPNDPKVHDACATCHELEAAPLMNGKLIQPPGTKGVNTMKTDPANCVDCHTDGLTKSGSAGMHHTSSLATAGTCQACHTNAKVDTGVAPEQLACRQCHVNINGENGVVVTSLRLSLASGSSPTKFDNTLGTTTGVSAAGVVTSHTIANGTPTAINDLRICFACHDGTYTNDSAVTAQAVTPFHGYPGDLAQGSLIDTGQGGFARKTNIDGGTMAIDETIIGGIPLIFQYYHPGHNHFRRFSTPGTAEGHSQDYAITRRSDENTQADNIELYRGGRPDPSPTGTVPSTGNTTCGDPIIDTSGFRDLFQRAHVLDTETTTNCANVQYGGRGVYTQLAAGSRTAGAGAAGRQWEPKGYGTNFFTAPYTLFNAGNKPADTTEIPYFTALGAPNDRVFVYSAEVNASGNLVVIASNDESCGQMTVTTQPDSTNRGTMILNGTTSYCEKTVTSVSPIPTTVDVTSSGTGTPSVTGYPVYALVAATANPDTFGAAGSGNTILDVLTNDTGTALQIVISTITGVTRTGGAGTCGTLTPTINTITYTGGDAVDAATCTFDYEAQAYDGLTPYGSAFTATVTVNQTP